MNMNDSNHLTEIIEMIGINPTIRLCRFSKGKVLTIPESQHLTAFHWLSVTVGMDNAFLICTRFAHQVLDIPSDTTALLEVRDHQFLTEYQSGQDLSAIARKHQIDRKAVQKVIHKTKKESQR
jgi:hypothetical protein